MGKASLRILAGLLAVVTLIPAAQALYEDVGFTSIITDTEDYPPSGFLDILDVSIGEPGDATVVFRFQPVDITDAPPVPSSAPTGRPQVNLFYTVGETAFRSGYYSDGAPGSTNPFDSCSIEGEFAYCVMKYTTLSVNVGGVIAAPNAVSYGGLAQDVAPGNLFADEYAKGAGSLPVGTDYTLVGSTVLATTVPDVIETDLTTQDFLLDLDQAEPLDGTYLYHWPNAHGSVDLRHDVQITTGTVSIQVVDAEGTALLNQTFDASGTDSQSIDPAAQGTWDVRVVYTGFTGNLTLAIEGPEASPDVSGTPTTGPSSTSRSGAPPSGTGTSDGQTGEGTSDEGKGTPGLGIVVLLAFVAVALVARRRL